MLNWKILFKIVLIDKTLDVRFMSEFATNKMKNKTNNFFSIFFVKNFETIFLEFAGGDIR